MWQHCMGDRDARIQRLEDKNKYTSRRDLGVGGAALHGELRESFCTFCPKHVWVGRPRLPD